jgi:integrase
MARPSKTAAIDYTATQALTHGLLDRAACPDGVAFVLVRDSDKKGLRLRITKAGGKHWQFETRVKGKLFTRALGEWPTISIEEAKAEAHRLRGLTEQGIDPRDLELQQMEAIAAQTASDSAAATARAEAAKNDKLTVSEVWTTYIEARRPHWSELHLRDHIDKAKPGGLPSGRRGGGKKLTQPGPLAALMPLALKDLDQTTIESWADKEGKTRATSARLALRLLGVFLNWCVEQPEYTALIPARNPTKTKKSREALGKAGKKRDGLQREQLPAWFKAVSAIKNPHIAVYLQVMLLTGARPNEILTMQWDGVNFKWKGLTIRDKVDRVTRERTIPLTPYVGHLLATLPHSNNWVFSSPTSKSGHIAKPNNPHTTACTVAGIGHLTLHGLRRTFKSQSEWLVIPDGVRQNIMGHVARSTDEDYTIRALDLLRVHHERIEAWILEQAGIVFNANAAPSGLRVIAN